MLWFANLFCGVTHARLALGTHTRMPRFTVQSVGLLHAAMRGRDDYCLSEADIAKVAGDTGLTAAQVRRWHAYVHALPSKEDFLCGVAAPDHEVAIGHLVVCGGGGALAPLTRLAPTRSVLAAVHADDDISEWLVEFETPVSSRALCDCFDAASVLQLQTSSDTLQHFCHLGADWTIIQRGLPSVVHNELQQLRKENAELAARAAMLEKLYVEAMLANVALRAAALS